MGQSLPGSVGVNCDDGTKEEDAGTYLTAGIVFIVAWVGRGFVILNEGLVWGNIEFEYEFVLPVVTFGIEGIVNPLLEDEFL